MLTRTQGGIIGWAISMLIVIGVTSCGYYALSDWADYQLAKREQVIEEVTK